MDAETAPDCLVFMAFGKTGRPMERNYSLLLFDGVYKPAIEQAGLRAKRSDIQWDNSDQTVTEQILRELKRAAVVLIDVTDNNPNVCFELGLTLGWKKPRVIVSSGDAAWWPAQFQILKLGDSLDDFRKHLVERLNHARCHPAAHSIPALEGLTKICDGPFNASLQARVANWRISATRDHVEQIRSGVWRLETHSPTVYTAHNFQALLNLLGQKEKYLTVTNMSFWRLLKRTQFHSENGKAAAGGVVVQRVFLLEKQDLTDEDSILLLNEHADMDAAKGTKTKVIMTGGLEDAIREHGHFAILQTASGDEQVVVAPDYGPAGVRNEGITHLVITFKPGTSVGDHLGKFNNAWQHGRPLETLLKEKKLRRNRQRQDGHEEAT